jgi:hypothetical protein
MTDENTQALEPAEAATAPETDEQISAESAPAAESPERDETETDPDKPKGGFQRRISELTRNWREAERRNDELISLLSRGREPEPATPAPVEPPSLAQFDYDETKYQQALFDYTRKEAAAAARAEFQSIRQEQAEAERVKSFKAREAEFANSAEDYADVVYDPSATFFTRDLVEQIRESEIGPQLAYYLAKNPAEGRRIAALPPMAAGRELGRIESKLGTPAPKATPVSKAPPPPPKLEASQPDVEDDPDKMPIEKWVKWREKDLRKKGKL